jgi:hypothetical protein
VQDETGGDPMSDKKWVRRTLRQLSKGFSKLGYQLGKNTIGRLLKKHDYTLRQNRKEKSTKSHPDRDRQFQYINRVKKLFLRAGYPVISVDTKKKELIGNFYQSGKTWKKEAELVNSHDFPQDAKSKAVPYGIYDLYHNQGYVYVGTTADTSEFAVDAIDWWWQHPERPRFEREDKLLILCDAGGSNDHRRRLWKRQIQSVLADSLGLEVMVCHYPSGASKWNPIEHRLFSYISLNWAGEPKRSLSTMLNYLRGTKTDTGLKVEATLTQKQYEVGLKVKDQEMKALNFERRRICPQWNYLFKPRRLSSA